MPVLVFDEAVYDENGTKVVAILRTISFRGIAKLYTLSFFSTLAFGGVLTYTMTDYSADTDKIQIFYGVFNPCIWFDHYPAKVFAMTGMGIFLMVGLQYSSIVLAYAYKRNAFLHMMWIFGVSALVSIAHVMFVNVFVTDLYAEEQHHTAKSTNPTRRLHGAHHAFLSGNVVATAGEDPALSAADLEIVKLHTFFYILWMFAELNYSVLVARFIKDLGWEPDIRWQRVIYIICKWIGYYGMVMHACAMLIIILQPSPKDTWYFKKNLHNVAQHYVIFIDGWTATSFWGWIPCMLFRLSIPAGRGVYFQVTSEPPNHDSTVSPSSIMHPHKWINRTLRGAVAVMGLGGVFSNAMRDREDVTGTSLFVLSEGLKIRPYSYFAAPVSLALAALWPIATSGLVWRVWLKTSSFPRWLHIHGTILWVFLYGSILSVLEEATFAKGFILGVAAMLPGWVIHVNLLSEPEMRKTRRAIIFCIIGPLFVGLAAYTEWMFFHYLILVWVFTYEFAVPAEDFVHVTLDVFDVDTSPPGYKPVVATLACPSME